MKHISIVTLTFLMTSVAIARDCKPTLLRPEVLELVNPYIRALTAATKEEFTEEGRYRAPSTHRNEAEKLFYSILENRTQEGDEAVAYLLNIYHGSHPGEELVCEAINRGKRILPLVRSYASCTPLTGLEPLNKFIQGSGRLPQYVMEGIEKGDRCKHIE